MDSALSSNPLFCDRFDEIIESISYSESINCDDMAKFVSNRCHTRIWRIRIAVQPSEPGKQLRKRLAIRFERRSAELTAMHISPNDMKPPDSEPERPARPADEKEDF
jgi:hypothetical protein